MCEDGDGEDEVFQAGGLVDWSREQEVGLAGGDGAGNQRDERGIGEMQDEEYCWWVCRVSLDTGYCVIVLDCKSHAW